MNSKKTKRLGLFQFVLMAILFLLTLTMVVPLLHILARSLSDPLRSGGMNGLDILPKGLTFINYQVLFSNKNVLPSIFNSIFITLVGTVLNILLTILAAYALTRPQLVGKRVLMVFFIIMMLFDPGIVPEYMVVKALKLTGSQWSIILCQAMNVYYLIVMMRYFEAVPPSLYEAARIDGASRSRIFWRITLPMISPSLFYLIITGFIGAFKAYSDAVALFGTDLNAAGMNTLVGFVYDMLYGRSGGYPSYASAAAIFLFAIVLTITCVNLLVSKKHVHYV